MKPLFLFFITSLLCLTLQASEEIKRLGSQELLEARKNLTRLGGSDPNEAMQAVQSLTPYAYREVVNALTHRLDMEVSRPQPNAVLVHSILDTLKKTATADDMSALAYILSHTEKTLEASSDLARIKQEFSQVLEEISKKSKPLPFLNAASRDLTDKYKNGLFAQYLGRLAEQDSHSPEAIVNQVVVEVLTDRVRRQRLENQNVTVYGRDDLASRMMNTLVRIKGKNPVLIGPTGVGKTAVVERFAEMIVDEEIPQVPAFRRALENAEIIVTTPAQISQLSIAFTETAQANALEQFMKAVLAVEHNYRESHGGTEKPIIVMIDSLHLLSRGQAEAIKPYLNSKDRGIRFIGAANSRAFQTQFKENEGFLRLLELIGVPEFSQKDTVMLLMKTWVPFIEELYGVKFSVAAIEAVVRSSPFIQVDTARPDGPFKVLQDIAIQNIRKGKPEIEPADVYVYAKDITGVPSNPLDGKEYESFLAYLKEKLKGSVPAQAEAAERVVENFGELLLSEDRKPKVVVLLGGDGTGKRLLAEKFAALAFNNRYTRIDGSQYTTGEYSLNTLFGAPAGVISSDKRSGVFIEWLDDPSQGKMGGVIFVDRAESLHPDAWNRLLQDAVSGGDGQPRNLSRHIFLISSTTGYDRIFPQGLDRWSDAEIEDQIGRYSQSDVKRLFTEAAQGAESKAKLTPNVINKVDEFVVLRPITKKAAVLIAEAEVVRIRAETLEKFQLDFTIDPAITKKVALTGFSSDAGGTPVTREIRKQLTLILRATRNQWDVQPGDKFAVNLETLRNKSGQETGSNFVISNSEGLTLKIPFVDFTQRSILEKQEMAQKLRGLREHLSRRLIGQDAVVGSISQAVIAQKGGPNRHRPVALYLVGATGTGKTETGKALAEHLYDSSERVRVIPMAAVQTEADINNIFGSAVGYSGHTTAQAFENALAANPQGAVIVWDDISNMGGNNPGLKEALFRKFYHPLDEGTWTSSVDGREYDLSLYTFLFTGNDLEKLLQGISSDDARLAAWKQHKSRASVRRLLREGHVPEAFIGRMADVIFTKPLLTNEMVEVTRRLLNEQVTAFKEKYKGLNIEYDDEGFVRQLAETFFTQDMGGRSVRTVLENRLGYLLIFPLLEMGIKDSELSGLTLKLGLKDNLTAKPYTHPHSPVREVVMSAELLRKSKSVYKTEINLTEFASQQVLPHGAWARVNAFHEMGHALLNEPKLTGTKLAHVTIKGGVSQNGAYYGYARYVPVPGVGGHTRASMIAELAKMVAGGLAQTMAGFDSDNGIIDDRRQMRRMAFEYLTKWADDADLLGLTVSDDNKVKLTARQREMINKKVTELIKESERVARIVLEKNWHVVRAGAHTLLKNGFITGDEFEKLRVAWGRFHGFEEHDRRLKLRKEKARTTEDCSSVLALVNQ